MNNATIFRLILSSALLGASACGAVVSTPPTPIPVQARSRLVVHKSFRVGAFDFGYNRQKERDMVDAIPAMLLTELRDIGRFSVYEGGNIRSDRPKAEALNEENARQFVDAYLSGTVIGVNTDKACFDLRLANSQNHEILYAVSTCVDTDKGGVPMPQRAAIRRMAEDLSRAVKQVGYGTVKSVDGQLIICDKGASAGVQRGMVAYLVSTGDSVREPSIHQKVQAYAGLDPASMTSGGQVVVGEMYVLSVEPDYSIGYLYSGDYGLPGDTVFFK